MLEEFLQRYHYKIDEKQVRKIPLEKRDHSKLLIYNTQKDEIIHDFFYNIDKYLPGDSALLLNQTKVLPARLPCVGKKGGRYDLFLVLNEWSGTGDISVFTDKSFKGKKSKTLYLKKDKNIEVVIHKKEDGITYLKNIFNKYSDLVNFLEKYGETPVPHYLQEKETTLDEKYLRTRYQTIFATEGRSVAAPTASLHFTPSVFNKLKNKNILPHYVTLDIGRGTFSNLKEENLLSNKLHKERYFIGQDVKKILEDKNIKKVVVGTTVCRTVESYGKTGKLTDETDIFIRDNFAFKYTDILLTNFHQPETSLMALVDSFLTYKHAEKSILDLYKIALENDYAFYSFGDSMLIL